MRCFNSPRLQELGLARWKGLAANEKESYKVSRMPRKVEEEGAKRKRSEEEEEDAKKPKVSTKAKLAGFAFSGN